MATKGQNENFLFVAAIDFGTTFSGYAFASLDDITSRPMKWSVNVWHAGTMALQSHKAPTTVLFDPNKKFHSFGYAAEDKYTQLIDDNEHSGWYFFRRFKMTLFDKMSLKRRYMLEEEMGKKMPAIEVFSAAIRGLKADLMTMMQSRLADTIFDMDIRWVITVPAIWNDASKQFMREAATYKGEGIPNENLLIALEPEAASLFCHHLPIASFKGTGKGSEFKPLQPHSKYVVFDAGGGTVDITAHEVDSSMKLKELYKANGGSWGGIYVDKAFRDLLADIVGNDVLDFFASNYMGDYIDLFREFEVKKRTFNSTMSSKLTFKVPVALNEAFKFMRGVDIKGDLAQRRQYKGKIEWLTDKLRMDPETAMGLFQEPCESAALHLKELLQKEELKGISTVLMVGGFAESPILQAAVKKRLPNMRIVIPDEAGLAVLKGAVIFGHFPDTIAERKCRYTYGIGTSIPFVEGKHQQSKKFQDDDGEILCGDIFDKHIEVGQPMVYGEAQVIQSYSPTSNSTSTMHFNVYTTTDKHPTYTDDDDVQHLGRLEIAINPGSLNKAISVHMTYGGTELEVTAKEEETGRISKAKFDFLG